MAGKGWWQATAALVAAALAATACSGNDVSDAEGPGGTTDSDPTEATPVEPVELSMWLFGDFGYDPLIEEYEAANPHVTIETQISEFAAHHDALTAALAGGSGGPDVAAIEVGFIAAMKAQSQAFANLRDLGADALAPDYLDWKWDQATTLDGSSTIALPTDVGGMAICYRADLFEAAGLPTDREEVAALWRDGWDDFIAVGERYTEATGKPFVSSAALLYQAVIGQHPDTYYDGDGELIYTSSPQVEKAWDVSVSAIDAGVSANIPNWTAEWNAGMDNGDYAVLTCPAWMMGYIQGQAPDTAGGWDIAAMPEGGGNWGGSFLAIPAQSDEVEAAYDFISWLLAPEQQLKVFEGTGNFPSTPALYDQPAIQSFSNDFFSGAPVGPIYAANAKEVVAQNLGERYETIDTEFEDALARVENGEETAAEAWASAIANVQRTVG